MKSLDIFLLLAVLFQFSTYGQNPPDISYITVYGKVITGTPQIITTTASYNACLALCMENSDCVLAYGNTYCQIYEFGNVNSVQQTTGSTSGPDDIVTFRVNRNYCPSKPAVNPPTFDNYPATGKIETNETSYFYRITLTSGVWTFEYLTQDSNMTCAGELFVPVERKFGVYCVRLVDRKYAKSCGDYYPGALFSGLEVESELHTGFINANYWKTMVHVNAKMTTNCLTTGNCDDIWLGVYLTPPNVEIDWLDGYPNSDGDCVAVQVNNVTNFGFYNRVCSVDSLIGIDYCVYLP